MTREEIIQTMNAYSPDQAESSTRWPGSGAWTRRS
jgi:hypothetical protein